VLEGKAGDQIVKLLIERPGVERHSDLPARVLRMPVRGLEREDNCLA
jgi:hypothetical protein